MAGHASLAERFVFENERPALRGVALETGIVLAQQGRATAFDRLREIRSTADHGVSFVGIMAIGATHFAFEDRVMMRQLKLGADLQVTLEASGRRSAGIHDRVRRPAALDMKTSRPVTGFAADILGVVARSL